MDNKTVAYVDSLTLPACVGSWPVKNKYSKDIIRMGFRQDLNTQSPTIPSFPGHSVCDLWYTKWQYNSSLSKSC